jgi:hypothetical protein
MKNYDTKHGIDNYLKDGIPGLHRLNRDRFDAGYKRKERLQEWVVLGKYYLDGTGNLNIITDPDKPWGRGVMTKDEYWQYRKQYDTPSMSSTPMHQLPAVDGEPCAHCGEGWTLQNVWDVYTDEYVTGSNDRPVQYHRRCRQYDVDARTLIAFTSAFEKASLPLNLTPIPNQYGSEEWRGPWFRTNPFNIKVGWRKSVIHLDWSATGIDLSAAFEKEDVTKGDHYIHAWGYEKLTAYLKVLGEALGKKIFPGT